MSKIPWNFVWLFLASLLVPSPPTSAQLAAGTDPSPSRWKPIHEMSDAELDQYLQWLATAAPTPAERVAMAALQSIGQPYNLYAPMLGHRESNCVVHVEHALAMGVSWSWESYVHLVTRLRYAEGVIPFSPGTFTLRDGQIVPHNPEDQPQALRNRNLFTLAQWLPNNSWCLEDITQELGEGQEIKPWIPLHHIARPKEHLAKEGVEVDLPDIKVVDAFIPHEAVERILPELWSGDVAMVIVGDWNNRYSDHMGIIVVKPFTDDSRQATTIVHSVPPRVRQEPLVRLMGRAPRIQGFKFLRLRPDAATLAAQEDARMANRMTVPSPGID